MKKKKSLIVFPIIIIFITFFLCYTNIYTYEIIEESEVLEDGSIIVTFTDENGTFLSEQIGVGNFESVNAEYIINYDNVITKFGDDFFISNIWIPEEDHGCLPSNTCFNTDNNKYYYYGGRRLIIVNGETNEVIKGITVSETGKVTSQKLV